MIDEVCDWMTAQEPWENWAMEGHNMHKSSIICGITCIGKPSIINSEPHASANRESRKALAYLTLSMHIRSYPLQTSQRLS